MATTKAITMVITRVIEIKAPTTIRTIKTNILEEEVPGVEGVWV